MSTNVKIEPKLLNEIIKLAKKENTTEQQLLTEMIKEAIEIRNKETTFDRLKRLTNGKIKIANKDTFNPNPTEKELNSIVGISEAPKDFDVVKAVEDSSVRKWK